MKTDAFGARATFDTGFGRATLYRLDALEKAGRRPRPRAAALLDPGAARGRAAQRRRRAGAPTTT